MLIEAFLQLRPFAYHTTASGNLDRIRRTRTIESTQRLFELAGQAGDPRLRERRRGALEIAIAGTKVSIRDQDPLHVGAIAFTEGWDLARLVEHINGFAFFWPGGEAGPIPYGRNHFERYAGVGEALQVVRIPTRDLLAGNRERIFRFSRVNSGATRMHGGEKVPRGEGTFRTAEAFDTTPGDVKEIVVEGCAVLPASTQFAESLAGPWRTL